MQYDRPIKISLGASRRATNWTSSAMLLAELYDKIKTPVRSIETMTEYLRMKKSQQDDLKDVGGFVGGTLHGTRRKASNVATRELLTLDLDNVPAGDTYNVLCRLESLNCGYCVYSTRKHRPDAPRLRVILPLDRPVSADEYEPIARQAARYIDAEMRMFDPTTFEASRLMYFPSVCKDSEYIFQFADKPMLCADGILGQYENWQNYLSWPQVPGQADKHKKFADKQEDPTTKKGLIGAFCRTYNVFDVMHQLLTDTYTPTDIPNRYTYTGGSTAGGAIVYGDGAFLFSHHATDPAGGQLCNAYDLLRLHKFGDRDEVSKPDTPTNKLPSTLAMREFVKADTAVMDLLDKEQYAAALEDFNIQPTEDIEGQDLSWLRELKRSDGEKIDKTTDNILMILENDPNLKGRIITDNFANRGMAIGPYPWETRDITREWNDIDDAGIRWYLEKIYGITGEKKSYDAVSLCGKRHAIDPVQDYLNSLTWDGESRLDTVLIDYLGAADNVYTRTVARKMFCGAVARALCPGIKFDYMATLTGAQGIGKSTFIRILGRKWFSDSLKTLEGKEACEQIQGVWIVEIGELEAMNRSEIGRIKQFLSQCDDIFRVPYGRRTERFPRRCVFFGTSNDSEYLRDHTGGRRFLPVDVGIQKVKKSVFNDLEKEVDQLWAEAVVLWRSGEPLYMTGEAEEHAKMEQESHREISPKEGEIREFVDKPVPSDWNSVKLEMRRMYWQGSYNTNTPLVKRDRVCAVEVWRECFGRETTQMKRSDVAEINGVLSRIPGAEKQKNPLRFGPHGLQKGFKIITGM